MLLESWSENLIVDVDSTSDKYKIGKDKEE